MQCLYAYGGKQWQFWHLFYWCGFCSLPTQLDGQAAERLLGTAMQYSYPPWRLECWGLLGLLQTSTTGQEPWHDDRVRCAAWTTWAYFDMLPVYLLLCVAARVLRENGHSFSSLFSAKDAVTFLSQKKRKEFRTQPSTNITWINDLWKRFL